MTDNRLRTILVLFIDDKYRVILGRTWDDFQEQQTVDPSYVSSVYFSKCTLKIALIAYSIYCSHIFKIK